MFGGLAAKSCGQANIPHPNKAAESFRNLKSLSKMGAVGKKRTRNSGGIFGNSKKFFLKARQNNRSPKQSPLRKWETDSCLRLPAKTRGKQKTFLWTIMRNKVTTFWPLVESKNFPFDNGCNKTSQNKMPGQLAFFPTKNRRAKPDGLTSAKLNPAATPSLRERWDWPPNSKPHCTLLLASDPVLPTRRP